MSVEAFSRLMSEQGYVPLFSRTLNAHVVIARDGRVEVPSGPVVYTLDECDRLLDAGVDEAGLRDFQRIKAALSGEIQAVTPLCPVDPPGPSLAAAFRPAIDPSADIFASCFAGLPQSVPAVVPDPPPVSKPTTKELF